MPPEEFVYGKRNRTPTPVKQVINYDYGNKGKSALMQAYNHFISTSMSKSKLVPKTTKTLESRLERMKKLKQGDDAKSPYKMKIFSNIESKVKTNISARKSNPNWMPSDKNEDIDRLIRKVEKEIRDSK